MASRKPQKPMRNDALKVMTQMFGGAPGWEKGVAAAAAAAEIAEEVYALRERHGLTQLGLAMLIGSSQSAVARMENGAYRGHSFAVLRRMAAAVGEQVSFKFVAAAPGFLPSTGSKKPVRLAQTPRSSGVRPIEKKRLVRGRA
ncbi:MAG: helix-turn-helix transcriptional regulator [Gemmatimonadaceae bacterium]|nr:helix-turn-helix transcriptional regulator [Gemmatimonadaceae bacterium]